MPIEYRSSVFYFVAVVVLFYGQAMVDAEIPLSLAKKLVNYKSSSDFLQSNAPSSKVVPDPSADCQPRLTVVELPAHPDPNTIYVPSCVTAMRCDGCCFFSGHTCRPITVTTETRTVEEYKLIGDTFELVRQVDLPVETHSQCECDCRVEESDCNDNIHVYEACQCVCTTENKSCSSGKIWNEGTCQCQCPEIVHCFEDESFNFNTCSCQTHDAANLPSYGIAKTNTTLTAVAEQDDFSATSGDDVCSQALQCPLGEHAVLDQPRCVCTANHVPRRSQSATDDVNDAPDVVP